jgi:hypothetical protein
LLESWTTVTCDGVATPRPLPRAAPHHAADPAVNPTSTPSGGRAGIVQLRGQLIVGLGHRLRPIDVRVGVMF